ncbi:MAG: FecR domain-containing protein [Candidatus Aminicenantes bacterium]|nr:FecR domain-containing protein [Candidatus Aminicenantes bacterium]
MLKNRSIGVLFGAFLVLAPLFAAAETDDYSDYSFARLNYVRGGVSVQRASDLGTEKAEVNLPLVVGDKLLTMDGQAEVQFGRRNYLRIDSSAQVEFAVLPSETSGRINIHLLEGRAYLRVSSLGEEKGIEVHSPDASFYILEEGLYRFEVDAGNETQIFVHQGSAEAAGEKGSVVVRAMEKLSAARGVLLSGPESFYARSDGFDQWNESRDDLLARRSASAYLPSDISEYEEELGDNGRWVYEQPYGNVWVPYTHYVDWRPYYFGRWVWYPIIGWTWISSEPWGWCTSHYGRWHWGINLGWYWIPRIHWGPAWVSWYSDNDYVGWCPLSYYNRPVVIVDNHFYDSYRDPYYPINSRALTMVRRDQLQSPAISRHALAASQLSALGRINLRAEQPAVRPVIASSALRSPGSVRVPNSSGSPVIRSYGSNSSLANRGALSGPSLRSPLSGSTVRTYPSSSSYDRIRTTPSSSPRSTYGTGTSIRSGETSGAGNGYPSRIRNDETRQSAVKEYSSSRSYPSRDSAPSYSPSTGRSYSAPSRSYPPSGSISSPPRSSSYGSTYSAPSRSTPSGSYSSSRSYSAPRISGPSSSRDSSPSYSPSYGRSYSAPSRSYSYGGSSSSPYRSSSYGSTYSAPSRSYSAPSHSSSSSRTSSSSSKSSSSHSSSSRSSSSSSSSKSGSVRKK